MLRGLLATIWSRREGGTASESVRWTCVECVLVCSDAFVRGRTRGTGPGIACEWTSKRARET